MTSFVHRPNNTDYKQAYTEIQKINRKGRLNSFPCLTHRVREADRQSIWQTEIIDRGQGEHISLTTKSAISQIGAKLMP